MIKPMSAKNKNPAAKGYRLIVLCLAALALGCVVPLIALTQKTGTSKMALLAMESAGGIALAYVFALYLLKK